MEVGFIMTKHHPKKDRIAFLYWCDRTVCCNIARKLVFCLKQVLILHFLINITKALIRLRGWAGWSAPLLFANHQRQVLSRRGPLTLSLPNATVVEFTIHCQTRLQSKLKGIVDSCQSLTVIRDANIFFFIS